MAKSPSSIEDFSKFYYIKEYSISYRGYPAKSFVLSNNLDSNIETTQYGGVLSIGNDDRYLHPKDHLYRSLQFYITKHPEKLVMFRPVAGGEHVMVRQ